MNYTDPIIIYLAIGAPVAMHRFFQLERPVTIRTLFVVGFTLLVWPIEAYRILSRGRRQSFSKPDYLLTRENSPETIIAEAENIEAAILDAAGAFRSSVRSSRAEALDRYIGLAVVHMNGIPAGSAARDFMAAAGSQEQKIGARCLIRRNRRLLEHHLNRARKDVLKEFFGNGSPSHATPVRNLLLDLARVLNDPPLAAELGHSPAGIDKESIQWKPPSELQNNTAIEQTRVAA